MRPAMRMSGSVPEAEQAEIKAIIDSTRADIVV
jgi:hypothetical protein